MDNDTKMRNQMLAKARIHNEKMGKARQLKLKAETLSMEKQHELEAVKQQAMFDATMECLDIALGLHQHTIENMKTDLQNT